MYSFIIEDYEDTQFVLKENYYEMLWASLMAAIEREGTHSVISWANF